MTSEYDAKKQPNKIESMFDEERSRGVIDELLENRAELYEQLSLTLWEKRHAKDEDDDSETEGQTV